MLTPTMRSQPSQEAALAGTLGSAVTAQAIVPNDNADLAVICRAIYVGVAGNLKVEVSGGDAVTFVGVPAGTILPLLVTRVWATGTTASSLVGMQ